MRGSHTGALTRAYLHSFISESLWYDVAESERMYDARIAHAIMLAALHGNPAADLDKGNAQVHEMYIGALEAMPYFKAVSRRAAKTSTDELVEEWRKANAGVVTSGKDGGDGGQ